MTTTIPEYFLSDLDDKGVATVRICMQTAGFERAYRAFLNKNRSKVEGN